MIKINEGDYAYASARIRAREPKLLGSGHFNRMLEAPSAEEAYKVLVESGYGTGDGSMGGIFAFEALLAEEMGKCYRLLLEIAPQAEIVRAFQRRHDYFNIKVVLKAELSGKEVPPILNDNGTIGRDAIIRIMRERQYDELTPLMRDTVMETLDVFSRTQDPQAVDLLLDRAAYHQLATDMHQIESPFLHGISDMMVDITNIKMFIRSRSLNMTWDFIKKVLLQDGTIPENVYFENSDKPVDSFVEDIRSTRYGNAVRKGWELYKKDMSTAGLEKQLDDCLMEFVRGAKMVTMGVEPVVAYLFAKDAEIKNVRIIMTGKINRLPVDIIRERLRLSYA